MKVDVAIIGTGPAGGMAACSLADSGLDVAILEKETLPRHKPCGGLMPGGTEALFDWDIAPFIESRISTAQYLYNYREPRGSDRSGSPFILVNRACFDAGLVRHALQYGKGSIRLIEGFHVDTVIEERHRVVVRARGGEPVIADFLIAADGATSKTARCLNLHEAWRTAASIDTEVRVTRSYFRRVRDQLVFNYYCLPQGYGWIFPKADNLLSCGVATWGRGRHLKEAARAFLDRSIPSASIRHQESFGYPIPVYTGKTPVASRRVCLVGDAARLVDPVSGEGIRFALMSGSIAADTIRGIAERSGGSHAKAADCTIYQDKIETEVGKWLMRKYRFAFLPYLQAPEYYYRRILTGHYSDFSK